MPSVLLIDADAFFTSIYADHLRREGFDVRFVGNGEDALRAAADGPSAILLDLALPRIDGFTLLERLQADPATARIPAFVLTDLSHPRDIDRCLRLGARGYLLKAHCRPHEVVQTIQAAIPA
jgi:CheY-like chemotaxis protein